MFRENEGIKRLEQKAAQLLDDVSESNLLKIAFSVADRDSDGHLSIFKFTTNYRVGLETPTDDIREYINKLYEGRTLKEALLEFLYENM